MRRFAIALALAALAGCGASDDTIGFRVAGRVLDTPGGDGLAGAAVTCAATGRATRTGPDGAFSLRCAVPDPGDDAPPIAGIRFEAAGFAPVLHALPAIDGATYAAVVPMVRPADTRTVAIPTADAPATEVVDNATFGFLPTSLVDATGSPAAGTATVTLAAWDPSQPARPDDDPPFLDALLPPFPSHFTTTGGDVPYLRPIAAAYLDAGELVPNPDRGVDLTITSLYADAAFGGVTTTDNRLFRQDPATGVFVESVPGRIDQRNQLTGGIDAPGTWIWAKAIPSPTCVDVIVRIGDRPCDGAHARLFDVDVQGKDQTLLYEAIGSPGGAACLAGPAGRLARLEVWMADDDRLESRSFQTMTSAGGTCGTCPRTVEIVFDCARDADCAPDSSCVEGLCVPDQPAAPDAAEPPDAHDAPDAAQADE